jgi:parallel beta-helix repeat protein
MTLQHRPSAWGASLLPCALLALSCLPPPARAADAVVTPVDGMVIRHSVTLKPGTYALPKGLVVAGDGITVDASGVTLVGSGDGQAVLARNVKNLGISGLSAMGYRWGVNVQGGSGVTVEHCRIRDTAEEPPDSVWLDIWRGPDEAYGAAILLRDVRGGRIADNDIQHQQNGVSLYGCSAVTVAKNNASFQSGWGIHLNNSSDNVIEDNLADWCNRIHKRGERAYYPGADAAGLLMVANCSRNIIRRNFFRGGGDGVFVAGYNAPDKKVPCNDNLFEDNDGSYSPNNAFESTFCKGNIFRNNRANASNYGFWLGYSTDNVLEDNEIRRNRIAGVAIEHGVGNTFRKNQLAANSRGIVLWSRGGAGFAAAFPGQAASARNEVRDNVFTANGIGFFSRRDGDDPAANPRDDTLAGNIFYGNGTGALLLDTNTATLSANRFQANTMGLRVEGGSGTKATGNYFLDQPTHAWADNPVKWTAGTGNYWSGATGKTYTPAGPNPGTDTGTLDSAPPLPEGRQYTQDDLFRGTPR